MKKKQKKFIFFLVGTFTILCVLFCALSAQNPSKRSHTTASRDSIQDPNRFPMTWDVQDGQKVFIFDPKIHAWAAYDGHGKQVMTGIASGGRNYCKDIQSSCRTPEGIFHVYEKQGEDCVSSEFPIETDDHPAGGAPMPYCMYFHGGDAIHGSDEVATNNASHGCIRILPDAAKWLSENFIDIGTKVVVLPYSD